MNELIPVGPVSPLRQRLVDDMTMRRFSRETQRNYIRDVGRFATWLGRSPHTATAEDVRRFQIEQQEAGVPVPTMNSIVAALRFFFTHTLDRPDLARKLRTAHAKLNTTAFYTQVATRTMRAVVSPLDRLALTSPSGEAPDG
jgi:site-specific recombinase XerD